jgi:hypothetical protein
LVGGVDPGTGVAFKHSLDYLRSYSPMQYRCLYPRMYIPSSKALISAEIPGLVSSSVAFLFCESQCRF